MDDKQNRSVFDGCYEIYYIREDELKLLLAGLGLREWYGLFSGKAGSASINPQTINGLLAHMYQNGIIDWDGNGAAVRQPYADMLSAMLEKKICVTVQMPGQEASIRCCYLSKEGIVMMQKSRRQDDTLGMAQLPVQGFMRLMEEECARLETGESCVITRRSSENGFVSQEASIQRDGLRMFFIEWKRGSKGGVRCEREELGNRICQLFCTEDTDDDIG